MKHLAILTFALGMIAAPLQAHAQKPVEFNGMVFDPPQAPTAAPTTTTRSKTSNRQHHHHHHAHTSS